jgi:hypothetical protein
LFVATVDLAKGSGHPFNTKIHEILAERTLTRWWSDCAPRFARQADGLQVRRGLYFQMLFIVYFAGKAASKCVAVY